MRTISTKNNRPRTFSALDKPDLESLCSRQKSRRDLTLSAIVSERRPLLNLRYRILGSLADAEDVVYGTYA
jgi:hypothetical protein